MAYRSIDEELARKIASEHKKIWKKKLSEEKNHKARWFFVEVINRYIDPEMAKRLKKQYRGG